EVLDHGEERRRPLVGELQEQRADRVRARLARNRALILQESSSAVEPIPVVNRIERIEELITGDQARLAPRALARMIELVEETHERWIEEPFRGIQGDAQHATGSGRPVAAFVARCVAPA